ncbi:MAG TPA: hypothetical protein PK438_02085 [Clostridia bacterium]|nr:MAG: Guanosine-5'-triphosphate,3'-diphosphate pyrophosphatase [Firmicutes bacterium ADurb.Bin248]HOG00205.1 hypothetical protein [Clostridia bacterium]HOS18051.1 hypothetical protein [Clostridia bacterium]HPK15105.1 hypothetical protein [Clostridia bacterium]
MERTYAVIDIGSNTVRYMGRRGEKRLTTTRLAQGLVATGTLSDAAMERSVRAVCAYARLAKEEGLVPRAYATSAVRDAKNSAAFLAALKAACGVEADVLSGEREAEYALLGAGASEGGLVDVGGGSSQLTFGGFRASFPMGCVRAKDILAGAETLDEMKRRLEAACAGLFRFPRIHLESWTGVGGTVTTLGALALGQTVYDKKAVSESFLSREQVEDMAGRLHEQGGAARAKHPLLAERHDVIVPGALILLLIMRGMGIARLRVSDADGMEGYLKYLLSGES